jgi:hypothetical protein
MMLPMILASMALGDGLHQSIERAVHEELTRSRVQWSVAETPGRTRASLRIRIPHYVGILALDWVSTEICCGRGVPEIWTYEGGWGLWRGSEANPLPFMGSSLGRAFTMGTLAIGWELLDKYLGRHWKLGRKILRISFVLYAVPQINANLGASRQILGWEPPYNPMLLFPAKWRRN